MAVYKNKLMLLKIKHSNMIFQLSLFGQIELSEYTGD